jgi:hypothetical protein
VLLIVVLLICDIPARAGEVYFHDCSCSSDHAIETSKTSKEELGLLVLSRIL